MLPAVTLAAMPLARIMRMTRSAMLEVLGSNFVQTARAKGLTERAVVLRHVFRNALIPVVTMAGLQMNLMLGGSVVVEQVFAWPGLGRLVVEAVTQRDYPVVQAAVFTIALLILSINLVIDVLYTWLDPRVKLA